VTEKDGSVSTVEARVVVVVCTGSVPTSPALEGLADAAAWGSREATSARAVPGRLAVIGGGVVGCELAQAYVRLGSEVTLLAQDRLLGRMEDRAGELVSEGLKDDGVTILFGRKAVAVLRPDPRGPLTLTLDDGSTLEADELLVATGRRPATDDLGLAEVGLPEGKPLTVDASGRVEGVQGGWMWAAGDVTGAAPLTHMGKYAARAVGDAIAASDHQGDPSGKPDDWSPLATTALQRAVTQVVFTDPEVASVGPTAAQARESGRSVRCVDLDLAVAGTSVHAQDYTGWARLVVEEESGTLLGATFVGQDVAELLHSATVAVVGQVPLHRLWHAVPAYPTISEVWLRLLEADGF